MHLAYPVVLSSLLFAIGVYGVLARRNAVLVLMAVELMLNAVNLNLIAFDSWLHDQLHAGQALTLFTITIAAAEIGLGLAIVLMIFRARGGSDVDRMRGLAEADGLSLLPARGEARLAEIRSAEAEADAADPDPASAAATPASAAAASAAEPGGAARAPQTPPPDDRRGKADRA